jgi:hypothetical protein
MAYPTLNVTGKVYTSSGVVVTAGAVHAWLVPSNAVVRDAHGANRHKVASLEAGIITATGLQSFTLTWLASMVPSDAYYRVRFDAYEPHPESWWETWRTIPMSTAGIDVASIVVTKHGIS